MGIRMNKKEFVMELSKRLSYSKDKCIMINEILESNFFISKKNKDRIIEELLKKLNVSHEGAIKIYEIAMTIINDEVKNKLRHPFKDRD